MTIVILDTNVLVPLIVGLASRDYINKHGSCSAFRPMDFDNLLRVLGGFSKQTTIPHVLAEASNLLDWGRDPMRRTVLVTSKNFVNRQEEQPAPSFTGINSGIFFRLGLTDAMHYEAAAKGATIVTMDRKLHEAALGKSLKSINFNEIIDQS